MLLRLSSTGRRFCAAIVILGLLAGVVAGSVAGAAPAVAAPAAPEFEVLDLLNSARASNGLGPVQLANGITDIAEEWSGAMAASGLLSHRGDLVARIGAVAPNWTRLGENVGRGGSVAAIHDAFMNSSGHRANILGAYNYVGIGVVANGSDVWVTINFVAHPTPLTATSPPAPMPLVSLIRPDGSLGSSPDLTSAAGTSRLDTVVTGTDGKVYWTASTGNGFGNWAGLGSPPGGVQGDPSLVSWSPGRLDVFARGADNRLWQVFSVNGGYTWSGWFQPIGASGTLASAPEVSSWAPGRLDVFVRGTDGRIYQRFYQGGWSTGWVDMGAPPVGVQDAPAAVSWIAGRLDLFVRGGDDRLWQRFWDGARWSIWTQPLAAGVLASSPAAASGVPGRIDIAVRGVDNGVYLVTYAGGWWPWARLGTANEVIVGRPSVGSPGGGTMRIAARGSDNRAYLLSRN